MSDAVGSGSCLFRSITRPSRLVVWSYSSLPVHSVLSFVLFLCNLFALFLSKAAPLNSLLHADESVCWQGDDDGGGEDLLSTRGEPM